MIEFFKKTNIDFINLRYKAFLVSGGLIVLSILSLVIKGGPNKGIDFAGGQLIQFKFEKPIPLDSVRNILKEIGLEKIELQDIPQVNGLIIRVKKGSSKDEDISKKISEEFVVNFPENNFVIERNEFVGPTIGRHLTGQTFNALFFSFIGIVVYVGFRFRSGIWGVAGIIALMHDVFVTVGIFSILNKELTLNVIAALLTLAGYSINDTIVIFDRMRENIKLHRKDPLESIINRSVNETLSRTVITSLTVILVLVALFFFGGEVIHDFSFALLFGCIIGSYSTIFVASPIVYEWEIRKITRK